MIIHHQRQEREGRRQQEADGEDARRRGAAGTGTQVVVNWVKEWHYQRREKIYNMTLSTYHDVVFSLFVLLLSPWFYFWFLASTSLILLSSSFVFNGAIARETIRKKQARRRTRTRKMNSLMMIMPVAMTMIMISSTTKTPTSTPTVMALSPSSSSSSSPWRPSTWKFTLDFGREKGTDTTSSPLSFFSSSDEKNKEYDRTRSYSPTSTTSSVPSLGSNEWGASQGRLVISFYVQVTSDDYKSDGKKGTTRNLYEQDIFFQGRQPFTLNLVGPPESTSTSTSTSMMDKLPKYITLGKGEQPFGLSDQGAWTLEFPALYSNSRGRASALKCCWDVVVPPARKSSLSSSSSSSSSKKDDDDDTDKMKSAADGRGIAGRRNDIVIPAPARLFLTANAWREEELEYGLRQSIPLYEAAKLAQQQVDDQLNHETGDRRLDGTSGAVETLSAYQDMTQLIWKRNARRQEFVNAINGVGGTGRGGDIDGDGQGDAGQGTGGGYPHPKYAEDLPEGPWPGAEEWLSISTRDQPIWLQLQKPTKKSNMNDNDDDDDDTNDSLGLFSSLWDGVREGIGTFGGGPNLNDGGLFEEDYHMVGRWSLEPVLEDGDDNYEWR